MLPLSQLPKSLLILILKKMETRAWVRLRRTGRFISQLVQEYRNQFRFSHIDSTLCLQYFRNKPYIRAVRLNPTIRIRNPLYALSGLFFHRIVIHPYGDRKNRYKERESDRPKRLKALARFCKAVQIQCHRLVIEDEFQYFALYAEMFPTARIVGTMEFWPSLATQETALQFAGNEKMKNVTALTIQGDGLDEILPQLIKRFELLKIFEHSKTRRPLTNVRKLFDMILKGDFNGTPPREFKYAYSWHREIHNFEANPDLWEELENLPMTVLYKGSRCSCTDMIMCFVSVAFLLKSSNTCATVVMNLVQPLSGNIYNIYMRLHVDLRSHFDPEATALFLTSRLFEDVPLDAGKIYEIGKQNDWDMLQSDVGLLRETFFKSEDEFEDEDDSDEAQPGMGRRNGAQNNESRRNILKNCCSLL